MPKRLEITGQKFNRLRVLKYIGTDGRNSMWKCKCDCGKTIVASGYRLKNAHVQSCGCLQREKASAYGKLQGTHYMSKSPEYRAWRSMKKRCEDKNNDNYAGRGITVHHTWLHSFETFFKHIGKKPGENYSVDRKNNNKGYIPGNVRWATMKEQNNNRRKFCVLTKFTDKELLSELRRRKLVQT